MTKKPIPYKLDPKPLGAGGYAQVHRGVHRETGRVAAIKRPRPGDDTGRARFEREVEIQSQLDHPNIMPILEHGSGWYAMPLARRNLTRAVEEDRDVDGFQLATVMRHVARGLSYAHRRDLVHRDVNPNNILETEDSDVGGRRWVVADWGLVRLPPGESSPRLTRRDRALGTHGFVAPEAEADPHGADAAADVYSLGMVAHFALTNVWPRPGFPLPSPGWLWGEFVSRCTAAREERAPSMAAALRLLGQIDAEIERMENQAEGLSCPRCGVPMTGARCEVCGRVWD